MGAGSVRIKDKVEREGRKGCAADEKTSANSVDGFRRHGSTIPGSAWRGLEEALFDFPTARSKDSIWCLRHGSAAQGMARSALAPVRAPPPITFPHPGHPVISAFKLLL
jgi:hypothetical protein